MAELNNEEIRSTLQDLISSPDFDINDPDTKKQLNNILNQINVYSYLNHNKNYIGIRCLSKEEYDKYLINGTGDGSITSSNENVYHFINSINKFTQEASYASGYTVANYLDNQYYSNSPGAFIMRYSTSSIIFYTLIQDNTTNTSFNKSKENITFYWVAKYGDSYNTWWSNAITYNSNSISNIFSCNKNVTQNSVSINLGKFNACRSGVLYLTVIQNICFRPVFQYIDNNKSKNIYY